MTGHCTSALALHLALVHGDDVLCNAVIQDVIRLVDHHVQQVEPAVHARCVNDKSMPEHPQGNSAIVASCCHRPGMHARTAADYMADQGTGAGKMPGYGGSADMGRCAAAPGEDGGREADVVAQRLGAVVAAADGVRRSQDGRASIQGRLRPCMTVHLRVTSQATRSLPAQCQYDMHQ